MAIIDKPVDLLAEVKAVLGETVNGVGQLCTSTKINKWARHKPIRNRSLAPLSDADFVEANFGLDYPIENPYMEDAVLRYGYNYLRPRGLSVYEGFRMRDFDGYNHNALATIKPLASKDVDVSIGNYVTFEIVFEDQGDTDAEIPFSEIIANIRRTRGIDLSQWYIAIGIKRDGYLYYHTTYEQIGDASQRRHTIDFRTNEPPFSNVPSPGGIQCDFFICACQNRYTTSDYAPASNQYIAIPMAEGEDTGKLTVTNSTYESWIADIGKTSQTRDCGRIDNQWRYQIYGSYPEWYPYRWQDSESSEVYYDISGYYDLHIGFKITNTGSTQKSFYAHQCTLEFRVSPVNWYNQSGSYGTGKISPNIVRYFTGLQTGTGTTVPSTGVNMNPGSSLYFMFTFYDFWKNYRDAQLVQRTGEPIAGTTGHSGSIGELSYNNVRICEFRMNYKKD